MTFWRSKTIFRTIKSMVDDYVEEENIPQVAMRVALNMAMVR
jgi:hypothetical protein